MRSRSSKPPDPPTPSLTVLAGALATVLAAGALLGCSSGSEPAADGRPADPAATPTPAPSVQAPLIPSDAALPGQVIALDFADDSHGFVLLADCQDGLPYGTARGCTYSLAALDGESGTWELRDTPLPTGDRTEFGFVVEAASAGHARLSSVTGAVLDDIGDTVWVTDDAGRSWRRGDAGTSGTVPAIPEGSHVALVDERLAALMPRTAEYRLLERQPPLEELSTPGLLPDGRHWVAGVDPVTGASALAVSQDEGRGWRTLAPLPTAPAFAGSAGYRELRLVAGPDGLYAFESGVADHGGDSDAQAGLYGSTLLGIHVSGDDGRSWQRVWTHEDSSSRPGSVIGTPIAAADGSLVVYGDDAIYVSRDGGRSFAVERPGPPPEEPALTRAGYLLTDLDHAGHYRVSADGFTWSTIVLGSEEG
ncbi:hypothetical protein [Streptomyces sp. 6N223]|uniref:hypothetical protein n=1 Tax=Streptomyces sp. 6N223 TaxID=3457412 RepID=UPI003FD160B7